MAPTITPAAPTLFLPHLGRLNAHPTELICSALQALRRLYFPVIPSSAVYKPTSWATSKRSIEHSIHDTSVPDSGYASAEENDEEDGGAIIAMKISASDEASDANNDTDNDMDILRADPLERAYAIKWLTGFTARSDLWISSCQTDFAQQERTDALDEATSLLCAFIGREDEDEVAITRTFSFPVGTKFDSPRGPTLAQIHVELNDAPLSKEDHTSVGLQSWGSSIILADRFCLQPALFSLVPPSGGLPLRILELGAGTGMLSIVASKILRSSTNVEVVATDYHPDVLENLSKNIKTNFSFRTSLAQPPITVTALDWENPVYDGPFEKPFDIILAADVIYHPHHAEWIKRCVEKLLARPNEALETSSGGVFWLIIPVRTTGRHEGMDATVDRLFAEATSSLCKESSEGLHLAILHREEVGRQGSVGRADEGAYKLFKIGWVC